MKIIPRQQDSKTARETEKLIASTETESELNCLLPALCGVLLLYSGSLDFFFSA